MNVKQDLRITLLGEVYPFKGGISQYNSAIINNLSKKAITQVISFKKSFISIEFREKYDRETKNFLKHEASFTLNILDPKTWKKTAEEIISFNPDVLFLDWHWQRVWAYNRIIKIIRNRLPCRIILLCHEPLPRKKVQRMISHLPTRALFKKIGTFIVHSKAHQRIIEKFNPRANVLKLFLPVNDVLYQNIDRNLARKRLGLNGKVLLFFGYVREDKGLNYLISALYKVVKQMQATLLIAGEFSGNKGKYAKQIEALGLNDSVRIIDGYLPNKEAANCFSAADVILTPYVFDIPSGIISAAYAFEKPVITTNLPSLAEYVQNEKTGYVVEPKDSDSLAEAIIECFKKGRLKEFRKMINSKKKELSCESYCRQLMDAISNNTKP